LYVKNYTLVFILFIYIITSVILLLTSFYPRKFTEHSVYMKDSYNIKNKESTLDNMLISLAFNKNAEQYKIIEYPLIILFILTGGTFLVSSSDLVSIFLSIELQSYGLYLLCSIYRNSELATNAGLTYFLLGGLSSCIILLGQSLLYINTGNTYLDSIYIINNIYSNEVVSSVHNLATSEASVTDQYSIQLGILILCIGFLFKIAAAPFHFWSPDVYDAIPTIVTTFVAIIAKITIFVFLLQLVYYLNNTSLPFAWNNHLLLSSLLSLLIGSILGLTQTRIKRLFAYSTISHVGFILLALSINSIESTQAFYFYIIQYSLTNLNAFLIIIAIGYSFILLTNSNMSTKSDTDSSSPADLDRETNEDKGSTLHIHKQTDTDGGSPLHMISQLKGYFFVNPILSLSLGITIFSFAGIPPLVGFFGKQMILSAALDNGYIFMALVAILTSVIGGVYYLFIIKELFFEKNEYKVAQSINLSESLYLSSSLSITISILTLFILWFLFIPKELMNLTCILSI